MNRTRATTCLLPAKEVELMSNRNKSMSASCCVLPAQMFPQKTLCLDYQSLCGPDIRLRLKLSPRPVLSRYSTLVTMHSRRGKRICRWPRKAQQIRVWGGKELPAERAWKPNSPSGGPIALKPEKHDEYSAQPERETLRFRKPGPSHERHQQRLQHVHDTCTRRGRRQPSRR